ncbi:MAG: polysaccharide deacetylase family protein [Alphaproteobacteria bacterium]
MNRKLRLLLIILSLCIFALYNLASVAEAAAKSTSKKNCAITFDDGPHKNDYKILAILAKERVKATFYYNGSKVSTYPNLVKKVVASGHGLGNHSYSHKNLKAVSSTQQYNEIMKSQKILEKYGKVKTYRPAFGSITPYAQSVLKQQGLREVRWNIDTNDWRAPSVQAIIDAAADARKLKSPIILMHSTSNKTVAALPRIIKDLKRQNCRFVTY